ncbi:hypothetical protein M378DRAFT_7895 [Amanita muscaria Koide BX008]|uniref:Uncharacterized protein n=1 Tax=Amanita muscaria (strain Koide BX008) TaxID=946122 RepID=A0A0C2XIA0_AMAMK|nr:hypothetical protein M378DRAFT_7895 [Amanita muscaria Koide BX008]
MQHRFQCANAASSALEADPMFATYGFGQWNGHFKSNETPQNNTKTIFGPFGPSPPKNYDSTGPSSAYTQLKVSPRGSTISDIYSKHLGLVASETGKFEMTPTVFFNIVQCARDAEKKVENAVARQYLGLKAAV